MDFALDDTQQAVAGLARDVLAREPDPESAWKALGQAGLLSGEGFGVLETALVLTEVGRAAAPLPALSTLALGVLPIVHCGADRHRALLPPVAAGERYLTAALRGEVTADRDRLTGTAVGVPDAARAHRLLVPAGDTVFLVAPSDAALTGTYSASGAPEHTVVLDGVRGDRLCDTVELRRFALAGACAYGDGLLAGALALTAGHVRTREQFGRPLATFQAVAQQIADVYIASRTLHLAAWSAIWRLAEGRDPDLDPDDDLAIAAYWLAEEAMPALHTCHHLHGGLGVDDSYAMHRYYSATKDLVRLIGGVEHRLAAV
ncbi:acyl-CoA dehydrogenase family protein [Actinophytocola glycyrrhizae]|uniref:Acyl-CoA dehydrogenase family protein n=1 Tax=Actinophytocola glycyrrhizae TaxID=2044873 RepID=A0ABV9RWA0_9PSEU